MNLRILRKYLRLVPFETISEQGRSDERYRLAALTIAANLLSKGFAMVVMVLTVSLTIPYLGAERFGAWMTIASFVGMLSFLDLGVGNALTNQVSQVAARGSHEELSQTVSGGLGFLLVLGIFFGIFLFCLASILPWQRIMKINQEMHAAEVVDAIKVFAVFFGFSLFSNGIQRIFVGLQQAYASHLVSLAGSMVSLFALWIATQQEASIPCLIMVTLGIQLAANVTLLINLSARQLFGINRMLKNTFKEAKKLFHIGGLFFILQIGTMVGWGADSLIIASTLGASHVALFNLTQRLFQFIAQPLSMVNSPLWGGYADAHARGERSFVLKTLKKSMLFTISFAMLGGALLLCLSQSIFAWWTNGNIQVPISLVFVFFIWTICESSGSAFSMVLNGCGVVREQVVVVIFLTLIALPVKLLVVNYFGVAEMLAVYTFIYCMTVLFFYGIFFRKTLIEKVGI